MVDSIVRTNQQLSGEIKNPPIGKDCLINNRHIIVELQVDNTTSPTENCNLSRHSSQSGQYSQRKTQINEDDGVQHTSKSDQECSLSQNMDLL